ncbi:MAG: site-2 protease family protein [Gammaproteobacteria bacterium]|nr:site-2 protease family protein [Gammaproteobacteria bacterium]
MSQSKNQSPSGHSLGIAKIAGIEIRLDPSVIIIFALIVFSLAMGVFPRWHEDWGAALVWGTALVSGILFFISLLAHEMAHSLVSQRYGIPVRASRCSCSAAWPKTAQEPDRPWPEFLIAVAGPLMSVAISLACSVLVSMMVNDPVLLEGVAAADEAALAQLGPVETGLLWLGSINMILAIFNMIPGFPMDGGRVFRAIAWAMTGDKIKATRWASNIGRAFGMDADGARRFRRLLRWRSVGSMVGAHWLVHFESGAYEHVTAPHRAIAQRVPSRRYHEHPFRSCACGYGIAGVYRRLSAAQHRSRYGLWTVAMALRDSW